MNDRWALFQKFLITQEQKVSLTDFLINAVVIIILATILEFTYVKVGRTISNRRQFAGTFLLIAFTTMLIISIVKSSLALSLGLVGALSIVRFRAAIKEPEELAYLFLSIALGLGLGANQTIVVLGAFVVAMIILWGRHFLSPQYQYPNLYLNFSAPAGSVELPQIIEKIDANFKKSNLKRYDENKQAIEASFVIHAPKPADLHSFKKDMVQFGSDVRISFIESKSF